MNKELKITLKRIKDLAEHGEIDHSSAPDCCREIQLIIEQFEAGASEPVSVLDAINATKGLIDDLGEMKIR